MNTQNSKRKLGKSLKQKIKNYKLDNLIKQYEKSIDENKDAIELLKTSE
ncbi:hypothetical protein HYD93_02425 [Mycoplasmopsis bovis]|nr:hypothetical protein [Mycoplasmopsis bovis]QQH35204.1 hypothetical protein HYD93_02425 [Mycoplasmopsis bovis]